MLRDRVRRSVSNNGWGETLRRAGKRGLGWAVLSERHTWCVLDLAAIRPRPSLPAGATLRRGDQSDLEALESHDSTSAAAGARRLRDGNDLWLVEDGDRLLFSCWIFRGASPAIAAPGRQLPLPQGTVCQEESLTAPHARGRGIAPAAWAAVADELGREGCRYVIRKVETHNEAGRRAGEKAGFRAVAEMHFIRFGPISWTTVEPFDDEVGRELARRLSRAPRVTL